MKLERADVIKFSGELQGFATFKREFIELIVPNQEISEVSLHLKQSIPKKHLHLIDQCRLTRYSELMVELEKKFGGPRQIIIIIKK